MKVDAICKILVVGTGTMQQKILLGEPSSPRNWSPMNPPPSPWMGYCG